VGEDEEMIKKLLALDLSTVSTGYSFFVNGEYSESGTIIPAKKLSTTEKMNKIYQDVWHLFLTKNPDAMVVESPIFVQNHKTAITTGKLHGIILSICFEEKIKLNEMDNMKWKSHFFMGNLVKVTKDQIFTYCQKIFNPLVKTFDEADAICIGKAFVAEEKFRSLKKGV
jgi:Holliday junction resolvasome RuvABC endonuclease subunit